MRGRQRLGEKLKVLWIGPHASANTSGEAIYDRKVAKVLQDETEVTFVMPDRVGRIVELFNLAIGASWYRARYQSRSVMAQYARLARDIDVVVCSWEPFDFFAEWLNRPTILILHNVTSNSIDEMMPGSVIARFLSRRALRHERRTYNLANVRKILTLSRRDQRQIEDLCDSSPVIWCPPGAPPAAPLSNWALFSPELTLSGSYDWKVKKRDLEQFLIDISGSEYVVRTDDPLPSDLASRVLTAPAHFDDDAYCAERIRIGIIPDRFLAGHKLKATFYIAKNSIVLSYADIRDEFAGLPHADRFVRVVRSVDDIRRAVLELRTEDADILRSDFIAFKAACLERFQWGRSGRDLYHAVASAAKPTH